MQNENSAILKKNRIEKKLQQKEIAMQANISKSFYCMIENGQRSPSISTAKKIALVLGFDWTIFFKDDTKAG